MYMLISCISFSSFPFQINEESSFPALEYSLHFSTDAALESSYFKNCSLDPILRHLTFPGHCVGSQGNSLWAQDFTPVGRHPKYLVQSAVPNL